MKSFTQTNPAVRAAQAARGRKLDRLGLDSFGQKVISDVRVVGYPKDQDYQRKYDQTVLHYTPSQ